MRIYLSTLLLVLICVLINTNRSIAQTPQNTRILFLIDGSSSMLDNWQNSLIRFDAASKITTTIIDSIYSVNPNIEFGVRIFGHQYPSQENNCYDSKLEVQFGKQNLSQIKARLSYISARGVSPIAWSLKEAATKDFIDNNYIYSLILITDGGESCEGNICETVNELLSKKISFKPYILSLVDYDPLKVQYDCLGSYLTVANEGDISKTIKTIIDDNRPILTLGSTAMVTPNFPIIKKEEVVAQPVKTTNPIAIIEEKKQEPIIPIEKNEKLVKTSPAPIEKEIIIPATRPLKAIRSSNLRRLNTILVFDKIATVNVPKFPIYKFTSNEVIVSTTPTKQIAPNPTGLATDNVPKTPSTPLESKVTNTPTENGVVIYFTDGKGKFFQSEPNIVITNSTTNTRVTSTFRKVDALGQPIPLNLPPGKYAMTIPGGKSKIPNFEIKANQFTRMDVIITNGNLGFGYPSGSKRDISKYTALVSRRFDGGSVVTHPCNQVLTYEPNSFHIEINTMPPTMLFAEVKLDNETILLIDEPGTVKVDNTDEIGRVEMYYQRGDRYMVFYEMLVFGEPNEQTLELQPGLYQMRYIKPGDNNITIHPFKIESNKDTTIHLP